jgi:hypothetical protein
MIYDCFSSGRYTMKADIYKPVKTQDSDTGEIENTWEFVKTITCFAWGVTASGKDLPGTYEYFGKTYSQSDVLRLLTHDEINKDYRISNVRNSDLILWTEDNTGFPTVFDTRGSVPVTDAFGNLVEYAVFSTRSEVQSGPWNVVTIAPQGSVIGIG